MTDLRITINPPEISDQEWEQLISLVGPTRGGEQ